MSYRETVHPNRISPSRLPSQSLCDSQGNLDPIAPFIVLARMCYPRNDYARNQMLSTIRKQTNEGKVRTATLDDDKFMLEVRKLTPQGLAAGYLLITMAQLHKLGQPSSLNKAIDILQPTWPCFVQTWAPEWSATAHLGRLPTSRRNMIRSFNNFLPVIHYWAAFIHSINHERPDIGPGRNEWIPGFLGYAEAYYRLGTETPWQRQGDRKYLLPIPESWRFKLPKALRIHRDLEVTTDLPHP